MSHQECYSPSEMASETTYNLHWILMISIQTPQTDVLREQSTTAPQLFLSGQTFAHLLAVGERGNSITVEAIY